MRIPFADELRDHRSYIPRIGFYIVRSHPSHILVLRCDKATRLAEEQLDRAEISSAQFNEPVLVDDFNDRPSRPSTELGPTIPHGSPVDSVPPNPRREFVWKAQEIHPTRASLETVSQCFSDFLDMQSPDGIDIPLQKLIGRDTHRRTPHKCLGYIREEITLTSSITESAIFSHAYPNPREICKICGAVVSESEIFRCGCGENGEPQITVTCQDFDPCVSL